ncbi:hypothetical protein [Actinoplanes derwentensis]|uniref:Uncharacterized protein n=1 Tax=Actinoplanes derwentensis TaxID=113562 RepID=A0A1H1SSP8_9ACTN|nr:hypothetical protein [Actinoplanes derwentensis]GID83222.1 hypothetical protein Ade03nite_21460 [Actinoplanes derwentensis]SDS50873.1 hypothetical protein SAMN04489716_0939 [Actinoplanes derwentensis]
MSDPRDSLRRLVEEGALAARQPPSASLHRRAQRRRTARGAAIAVVLVAAATAALPLTRHDRYQPTPATTADPRTLTADPATTVSGGLITISGAGCTPGRAGSVGLRWDRGAPLSPTMAQRKEQPSPLATAPTAGSRDLTTTTDLATGTFTVRATIPADVTIRTPILWARCPAPGITNPLTQSFPIQIHNP